MHQKLIAYIEQYSMLPLTSEEQALIVGTFQPKKLRKKTILFARRRCM